MEPLIRGLLENSISVLSPTTNYILYGKDI